MTLPTARDLASSTHPREYDRARAVRDAAAGARCPAEVRHSLGEGRALSAAHGPAAEYARWRSQIVENRMLNGETIRLDGALRMPPR